MINKLRIMIRIRLFEEKVSSLRKDISGPLHTCIGQEAVSTGVCLALSEMDYIIGNHRSHGHLIAKGADVNNLMAEIFWKTTGTNGGIGGSMHVSDNSIGAICSTAIVGSGLPLACGMAFANKYKNENKITCVFFGDGAFSEGTFHESMNLASLWRLPVLFVMENNHVAVTTVNRQANYHLWANSYGISNIMVDGQDVDDVNNATMDAIRLIENTGMPYFIEAVTCRFHEHQEGLTYEKVKKSGYRDNEEINYWIEHRDPIELYLEKIRSKGVKQSVIDDVYEEEINRIEEAVVFALRSPKNILL